MEPRTERVVLILADISGYTRFTLANQVAMVHAQMVITKLLEEIIRNSGETTGVTCEIDSARRSGRPHVEQ